jgi:ubiquinone biosynthesis protein
MFGKFGKGYRHINRYRQIISILVKYGFEDIIHRLKIPQYLSGIPPKFTKKQKVIVETSTEERLRKSFEELGPSFIKLGQIISTRPDIMTMELINELKKLQDTVPPFSSEEARKIVKRELSAEINDIFLEFSDEPIASASIAQVHYAKLHNGDEVVIKIQRPNIKKIIEIDIEIMQNIAALFERYIEEMKVLNPVGIVKSFAKSIEKEMDFNIELAYINRFAQNFENNPDIHVPKTYKQFSTDKILVMEYIKGIKISEMGNKGFNQEQINLIVNKGADLILKQIFIDGFFHADPHPGNLMVLPGNVICFLDYGMMGKLYGKTRENFENLIISFITKNDQLLMKSLLELASSTGISEKTEFEYDVHEFIEEYVYRDFGEINIGKLFQKFLNLMVCYKFRIRSEFYLLIKTFITIEGLGCELNPDFNMVNHLEPFVKKLIRERLNPGRILRKTKESASEFLELLKNLPENMNDIISKIKSGSVHIEFEHKGLEPVMKIFERTYNHLILAIIISSLLLSSSLVLLAHIPPLWNNISIIGLLGFSLAGILCIILFSIIIRKK